MTYGIIQQVINTRIKNIQYQLKHAIDRHRNRHEYLAEISVLEELQQELIAEVEKKFPEYKDNRYDTSHWNKTVHYVITTLIGDNQ